jgi:hypothetical protein
MKQTIRIILSNLLEHLQTIHTVQYTEHFGDGMMYPRTMCP